MRQTFTLGMIRCLVRRRIDASGAGLDSIENIAEGNSMDGQSSESKWYSDRRVEPYSRNGRPGFNARRGQPLRGQLVPVTHHLDRVHNELVRQLGDKYLSLLDEFRRQHPELISDVAAPSTTETDHPETE